MPNPANSDKPAIILVHGFRGSPLGLAAIADKLRAAGYSVYAPAIPPFAGAKIENDTKTEDSARAKTSTKFKHSAKVKTSAKKNKSQKTTAIYNTTNYADFLANFVKKQNLHRPVLIGHSMGSIIVASTAENYPELINQKLILLSPISHRPAAPFAAMTPLSALVPRPAVDYLTTRYLFVPKDHQLFKRTLAITKNCSLDHPPARKDIFAAAKFSAHHSINEFNLTQDILILAGEHDRLINRQDTIELAAKLGAKLSFIANSGHLHNYEKPNETAALILNFLDS